MGRSSVVAILLSVMVLPIAGCANSGFGKSLQDSLAADSRLTETAPGNGVSDVSSPPQEVATLPNDFPAEIPRYPNATLQQVTTASTTEPNSEVSTVWQTADSSDRVSTFYREKLQVDGWQLLATPLTSAPGTLIAQRETPTALKVTVAIAPSSSPPASPTPNVATTGTQFTVQYLPTTASVGQANPSPTPSATTNSTPSPQPAEAFLGLEGTSDGTSSTPTPAKAQPVVVLPANVYTDLGQTPADLKRYVSDLAQLGVLNLIPDKGKSTSTNFSPNKPVSRREYARWLFEANNRLFSDRPAQQIRAANSDSQPTFRDVPRTDPDFEAIQGLAEAGIIPSGLSGDPTTVTFRPDAQLSRETMLLWKVPMDTRQPLPVATLDAIKQTWGFQDANRIDPRAQRAVLADFQNADLANIRRVFGYTTLFQPKRPVTRAEAAATLWYFGYQGDGVSAQDTLKAQ